MESPTDNMFEEFRSWYYEQYRKAISSDHNQKLSKHQNPYFKHAQPKF